MPMPNSIGVIPVMELIREPGAYQLLTFDQTPGSQSWQWMATDAPRDNIVPATMRSGYKGPHINCGESHRQPTPAESAIYFCFPFFRSRRAQMR